MQHEKNKILLYLPFLFCVANTNAKQTRIDSLKQQLTIQKVDSIKLQILWDITRMYQYVSNDSSVFYAQQEKWTTIKLVEKNKATRLANAKKTIEELENKIKDNYDSSTKA